MICTSIGSARSECHAGGKGRVALIRDAAFCVSLLAGQGSALAMISACVLANELARAGDDYAKAFTAYEAGLRAFIEKKQRAAERFRIVICAEDGAARSTVSQILPIRLLALSRHGQIDRRARHQRCSAAARMDRLKQDRTRAAATTSCGADEHAMSHEPVSEEVRAFIQHYIRLRCATGSSAVPAR